ncbi:MAG: ABC transporter ATP-binding protein [Pseudoxanthomonas suwonensis]|nr:MAG: ABC transporter ATP-binding protein [Pseudoxanthomonas suwonensis]
MSLIQLQRVDYGVGGPLLLDGVALSIADGDRIALIGRNGAGKSTLLKLLAGELQPDDGVISVQTGCRVARLEQEVPQDASGSVFDVVAAGLGDLGTLLAEYHHLAVAEPLDATALGVVQSQIDALDGWAVDRRVADVLQRLQLDGDADFARLSGGMKRRVLLARALVSDPQVLLLDEPTNHLDIAAIGWLEQFLLQWTGALVFVTHDRRFLRTLANRIVEIDRGQLTDWPGDWDNYLRRRDERLHAEAMDNARFDKLLAQEEAWIRQGIKARRTRDEGRVRRLQAMRMERAQRREVAGNVRMQPVKGDASGKKVIEAQDVTYAHAPGQTLLRDFSTLIQRGDRVGLIGPNGSGKTTLLRVLLGELVPQQGTVKLGTGLQIAYFDQYRATLREDWSALENVAEGRDFIELDGRRKHVMGYLQDFLFTPERARAPITRLSGGERNRLLLAKLFAQPSNLLVLDEPTNDLDAETLELLEELLGDYDGTVLLVSHDRDFLDQVVTSVLVMEGDGRVGDYVGGYSDWWRHTAAAPATATKPAKAAAGSAGPASNRTSDPSQPASAPVRKKLGYKETRELEQLPARIETLEADIAAMTAEMQDQAFYQQAAAAITSHTERLQQAQADLDAAYARWATLEG